MWFNKNKKKSIKKTNSKGFTLVEVLCAVVLLAIIATPIFQVLFTSLNLNLKSRKMLNASDLCASTTEFISTKVLENYKYDIKTVGADGKEVSTKVTSTGYRDYYCGGGDEGKFTNTDKSKLKLFNADPALAKLYDDGPACEYSSLSDWYDVDDAAQVAKIGPEKSYKCRELMITGVVVDGFVYDLRIKTCIPKKHESYYCGVVFVDVYETGKTTSLCSSKTSIANTY